MIPGSKTEFDRYSRDELRELYKTDPELFEKFAAEAIKAACVSETPEETLKLQQMQRTIDAQLRQAKTLLERTEMMEKLFYGNVFDLARIMETCSGLILPDSQHNAETAKEPVVMQGKRQLFVLVRNSHVPHSRRSRQRVQMKGQRGNR